MGFWCSASSSSAPTRARTAGAKLAPSRGTSNGATRLHLERPVAQLGAEGGVDVALHGLRGRRGARGDGVREHPAHDHVHREDLQNPRAQMAVLHQDDALRLVHGAVDRGAQHEDGGGADAFHDASGNGPDAVEHREVRPRVQPVVQHQQGGDGGDVAPRPARGGHRGRVQPRGAVGDGEADVVDGGDEHGAEARHAREGHVGHGVRCRFISASRQNPLARDEVRGGPHSASQQHHTAHQRRGGPAAAALVEQHQAKVGHHEPRHDLHHRHPLLIVQLALEHELGEHCGPDHRTGVQQNVQAPADLELPEHDHLLRHQVDQAGYSNGAVLTPGQLGPRV
mmetsp:Transcript_88294/g.146749  ORF Transcript_88294/g.146749 Transcript_88294/m.146749 type:complete len:339 (+) Transcript_88294:207-1223(+)